MYRGTKYHYGIAVLLIPVPVPTRFDIKSTNRIIVGILLEYD